MPRGLFASTPYRLTALAIGESGAKRATALNPRRELLGAEPTGPGGVSTPPSNSTRGKQHSKELKKS